MKCFFEIRWHVTNLTKNTVVATQEQEQQLPERKPKSTFCRKFASIRCDQFSTWQILSGDYFLACTSSHDSLQYFFFVGLSIPQSYKQAIRYCLILFTNQAHGQHFNSTSKLFNKLNSNFSIEKNTFDKLLLIWTRNILMIKLLLKIDFVAIWFLCFLLNLYLIMSFIVCNSNSKSIWF